MTAAEPFAFGTSTGRYPLQFTMSTDPASGLYVPGSRVIVPLDVGLLDALDGAVFRAQDYSGQVSSLFRRVRVLQHRPDADRRALAADVLQTLARTEAQSSCPGPPSPETSLASTARNHAVLGSGTVSGRAAAQSPSARSPAPEARHRLTEEF